MDVTKENFIAYERVRLRWSIDMNNTKEVARRAGIPQQVAVNILHNYGTYMELYSIETYIKRLLSPHERASRSDVGCFFMPHDDLVLLFGEPTVDIGGNGVDVLWSLPTTFGLVTIYTPSHNRLLNNRWMRKILEMWYIHSENVLAHEVIAQKLYAYEMQERLRRTSTKPI